MAAARTSCNLLLLACLLCFTACDSSQDEDPIRIRVINAASTAGEIDLFIDFELLARDLAFREDSPYITWDPGLLRLEARFMQNNQAVSISREVLMEPGLAYTILVTGTAEGSQIVVLEDDRSNPSSSRIRLSVVHGAPNVPFLNIFVAPEGGGAPVINSVTFGLGESVSVVTPAGTFEFVISAEGGLGVDLLGQTLEGGRRYLAVVTRTGVTGGLTLFLVADG